jgi:hypothetical protein
MKTFIAGLLSAGLLVATSCAASAGHVHHSDNYAETYPSATPRQLHNLRAYERGDYYEQLPEAVPFGSQVWWQLYGRGAQ